MQAPIFVWKQCIYTLYAVPHHPQKHLDSPREVYDATSSPLHACTSPYIPSDESRFLYCCMYWRSAEVHITKNIASEYDKDEVT